MLLICTSIRAEFAPKMKTFLTAPYRVKSQRPLLSSDSLNEDNVQKRQRQEEQTVSSTAQFLRSNTLRNVRSGDFTAETMRMMCSGTWWRRVVHHIQWSTITPHETGGTVAKAQFTVSREVHHRWKQRKSGSSNLKMETISSSETSIRPYDTQPYCKHRGCGIRMQITVGWRRRSELHFTSAQETWKLYNYLYFYRCTEEGVGVLTKNRSVHCNEWYRSKAPYLVYPSLPLRVHSMQSRSLHFI
jgi:hypothetical protein